MEVSGFENDIEEIIEEEEIIFEENDLEKLMDFSNPRMMNDKFYFIMLIALLI